MSLLLKLIVLIACEGFLLTGCSTFPVKPSTPPITSPTLTAPSWEQRSQMLSRFQQWKNGGAIAIRTPQKSFSANWQWEQERETYKIALFGPFGAGAMNLSGSSNSIVLETSDGKKFTSNSPETLIAEQLGWQLPVSHLRYWIRGLPVPHTPAHTEFDAAHRLASLVQGNWTIRYTAYEPFGTMDLPTRIFLDNPEIHIKMVINSWQILSH